MKKILPMVIGLLAVTAQALAGEVIWRWELGNETGWTRWSSPSGSNNWAVTTSGPTPPEGTTRLYNGQQGDFGWYRVIPTPSCSDCTIAADWAGDIDGAGWAEVMFFSTVADDDGTNMVQRIQAGNAADIAFKKDSWGMNPPTAWGWQAAGLSPHPGGNHGTVHSLGYLVLALKLGSVSGTPVWVSWDNITVTWCRMAPAILTQPASQNLVVGSTANFTVTATNNPPFSYRWRKNGLNLTDGGNISGATNSTLTLTNVQGADAGAYDVVVTNHYGSVTSAVATLTVLADIGLRAYDGTAIIKIAGEYGSPTSPLRIAKNGTNYGVLLVPTNNPNASKIRIPTASGTKALMKLP